MKMRITIDSWQNHGRVMALNHDRLLSTRADGFKLNRIDDKTILNEIATGFFSLDLSSHSVCLSDSISLSFSVYVSVFCLCLVYIYILYIYIYTIYIYIIYIYNIYIYIYIYIYTR